LFILTYEGLDWEPHTVKIVTFDDETYDAIKNLNNKSANDLEQDQKEVFEPINLAIKDLHGGGKPEVKVDLTGNTWMTKINPNNACIDEEFSVVMVRWYRWKAL